MAAFTKEKGSVMSMLYNFDSFGTTALKELLEKKLKVAEVNRGGTSKDVIVAIQEEIARRNQKYLDGTNISVE